MLQTKTNFPPRPQASATPVIKELVRRPVARSARALSMLDEYGAASNRHTFADCRSGSIAVSPEPAIGFPTTMVPTATTLLPERPAPAYIRAQDARLQHGTGTCAADLLPPMPTFERHMMQQAQRGEIEIEYIQPHDVPFVRPWSSSWNMLRTSMMPSLASLSAGLESHHVATLAMHKLQNNFVVVGTLLAVAGIAWLAPTLVHDQYTGDTSAAAKGGAAAFIVVGVLLTTGSPSIAKRAFNTKQKYRTRFTGE